MSHELRTPLTAVLGSASMLRKGSLDAARTMRALEAICNNARHQAQLIDELLDVSRIVVGRAALDLQELDLRESIRGAVEAVMPLAEAKGLEVRLGRHPSVAVTADPRRLEQILVNLLSNAVKFTPPGGWCAVDVDLSERSVEVRVSDSGAGIEPAFLAYIFERFRQAEHDGAQRQWPRPRVVHRSTACRSARRQRMGRKQRTGYRGSVHRSPSFDSRHPAIASFPADLAAKIETESALPVPSLDGIRVLVVDDEADVRELMRVALETSGASVISVGSAREALDALTSVEVDVLLADIAMPGQDGYDLIREVRALPSARASRVIAGEKFPKV